MRIGRRRDIVSLTPRARGDKYGHPVDPAAVRRRRSTREVRLTRTRSTNALPVALGTLLLVLGCSRAEATHPPGVIRLAMDEEPPQLDSTRATDQVSNRILGHVMEGLTRYGKCPRMRLRSEEHTSELQSR